MLSEEVRHIYKEMHKVMIDAMHDHAEGGREPSLILDMQDLLHLCKLLNQLFFSNDYDINKPID
jgi:gentisate 1,2-dioxygenase